jgi:RimJ/RimL family protein N-acetyltransferase
LRTARLDLRQHRETDLDDLLVFHSDPGVTRFTPWPVRDREMTREALARRIPQDHVDGQGEALCLAIEHRADARVIGEVILFWHSEEDHQGEIGYALATAYHRQGLAGEAVVPVLDWGFTHLGLRRISATVISTNRASVAVLAKLGLRHEGTLRDATAFEGGWADEEVWAITEPEWRAVRP